MSFGINRPETGPAPPCPAAMEHGGNVSGQRLRLDLRQRPGTVALGSARVAGAAVVAAALVLRLWIALTHTYVIFPDETFQYLEPAHRLAFGAGVVTWE